MEKDRLDVKDYGNCKSCGAGLLGSHCHVCGEKKLFLEDYKVRKFIEQSFNTITHFDSKVMKSARLLITKPGFLAKEYLEGRRIKYAKPFQLFFVINVFYFLVLNFIGFDIVTNHLDKHMSDPFYGDLATTMVNEKIKEKNVSLEIFDNDFYNEIYVESKLFIFVMIPMLAFWLMLIYLDTKKIYYEHLVFSTFAFCFILLFSTLFLNPFGYDTSLHKLINVDNNVIKTISVLVITVYIFLSLKYVYGQSNAKTFLKTLLTLAGMALVLTIYRFLIFLAVFYSI